MRHQSTFVALLGCLSRNSPSRAVADTLDEIAPDDVQVRVLDTIGCLPHFNEDVERIAHPAQVWELSGAIGEADAVVIVTPADDQFFPGVLKNALDWLGRIPARPFAGKPVAIQTVSAEERGGMRAHRALHDILLSLDALVLPVPPVIIDRARTRVDIGTGLLRDVDTRRRIARQLHALLVSSRTRPGSPATTAAPTILP